MSLDRAPSKRWATNLPEYDDGDYDDYGEEPDLDLVAVPKQEAVGPRISLPAQVAELDDLSSFAHVMQFSESPDLSLGGRRETMLEQEPQAQRLDLELGYQTNTRLHAQNQPPNQVITMPITGAEPGAADSSAASPGALSGDRPEEVLEALLEELPEAKADVKEGALRTPSILLATNTWAQRKQMLMDLKLKQETGEEVTEQSETELQIPTSQALQNAPSEWRATAEPVVLNTLVEEDEGSTGHRSRPASAAVETREPESPARRSLPQQVSPRRSSRDGRSDVEGRNTGSPHASPTRLGGRPRGARPLQDFELLGLDRPLEAERQLTAVQDDRPHAHDAFNATRSTVDAPVKELPRLPSSPPDAKPVAKSPVSDDVTQSPRDFLSEASLDHGSKALPGTPADSLGKPLPLIKSESTDTDALAPALQRLPSALSISEHVDSLDKLTGKRKVSRTVSVSTSVVSPQETFQPLPPMQPLSRFSVDSAEGVYDMGTTDAAAFVRSSSAKSVTSQASANLPESDRLAQELLDELQAEQDMSCVPESSIAARSSIRSRSTVSVDRRVSNRERARSNSGSRFLEQLESPGTRMSLEQAMDVSSLHLLEPSNKIVEMQRRIQVLTTAPSPLQAYLKVKMQDMATQHRTLPEPLPAKPAISPQPQRFEKGKDAARSVLSKARRANSVLKNLTRRTASGLRNSQDLS